MTLPLRSPDLSQVPECYDPVPPIKSHDIDGGYPFLSQTPGRTPGHTPGRTPEDQGKWFISQPLSTPRPMSQEVYDMVPPCPRPVSQNDDDVYDIPPAFRTPEQGGNYDVVPPPRPVSQSGLYDYVPRYNRNSYNPEETYDMVPCRPNSQGDIYDVPPSTDNYDVVPPPRPTKNLNNSDYYDTLPPPMASEDFQHENNTLLQPPARPPKLSTVTQAKDHYDIVPPPSSRLSKPEELGTENRDSGSYSDEIYDVPPTKPSAANDEIYDTPPRPSDVVYDELPWHREGDECYDTPPAYSGQGSIGNVPPAVNRSIKPSPVNRTVKPADHDYTNLNAPLVDRKCKPVHASRPNDDVHSYENMLPPNNKGTLSKSHSLPESETIFRNCHQTDYCDMQPYRSDDTRCYSFSRDLRSSDDNYEEMDPNALNRESGVHSNSSSEDGETEDCYMTMGPPEQTANPQRKAALQYCEVQIIDGQAKCQMPVPRRDAESHYTTINEESTQAFLQTCRQQQTSRN
ncbi:hypothetical protein QZH41_002929 [Actinostola sp. cb2023]|nr:hypothetical protein QZH41_002929 [Actinostola sp. cb2023]